MRWWDTFLGRDLDTKVRDLEDRIKSLDDRVKSLEDSKPALLPTFVRTREETEAIERALQAQSARRAGELKLRAAMRRP